ncbi:hypothetical protein K4K56_008576 [Colletotrichum sp. SAR 10_98]|nr:hypothetical protein K4K56_008576 [Colletotrichum sp. SAR 10_98]
MISVVSGGIAGLTIAARLMESSNTTVPVLEAGVDHTYDLNVPAPGLSPAMYGNPEYDRDYKTVAQQMADMLLDYVDQDSYGTGGPIVNEFPRLQSPLLRTWPRTLENLGLAVRSDPRDVKALGGYVNLLNIDGAMRSFAANAYPVPARCLNT